MSELSRRELFGLAKRVAIGVGSGAALIPASIAAEEITEEITEQPTGNPSSEAFIQQKCKQDGIPAQDCEAESELSTSQKLGMVVEAPFWEEAGFRAFPSALTDIVERELRPGQQSDSPAHVLAFGSDRNKFTRGEIIAGSVSSLIFGVAHNFTRNGFNKENIPVAQTMGGFALWGLQRRFGFLSNLTSHMTVNLIAINWPKPGKKK